MTAPSLRRTIDISSPLRYIIMHLVQGGRWLLVADRGSVTAYDLESLRVKSKSLICPINDLDNNIITALEVCVEQQQPLAFTMVLVQDMYGKSLSVFLNSRNVSDIAGPSRNPNNPPSRLCVWRTRLHGHGASAELMAHHVKSFDTPCEALTRSISFFGGRFARSLRSYTGFSIDVYDCNSSECTKIEFETSEEQVPICITLPTITMN